MRTFVTSDTHYFHTNIIKYCNRPFNSAEHMNDAMFRIWNEIVQPDDIVFHLGDFSLAGPDRVGHFIDNLNGKKILVYGNHDRSTLIKYPAWVKTARRFDFEYKGIKVHMRHTPFASSEMEKGHLYLHGHCHGNMGAYHDGQIDVGVDCWDFAPVEMEELIEFWRENGNS